jgi:hypothetical protein
VINVGIEYPKTMSLVAQQTVPKAFVELTLKVGLKVTLAGVHMF